MLKATEKQQAIVDSNARVKLIMGGVRSGKSIALICCVEKAMRRLGSRNTKVLIHAPIERFKKQLFRELKNQISQDIVLDFNLTGMVTTTLYGTIEIETFSDFSAKDGFDILEIERELLRYDIIAIDMSTRSLLFDAIINTPCNDIIAVGHCPEDENNSFYKAWISAYHGDNPNTKAFKLKTWDNPAMTDKKEEHEPRLLKTMGLERYVRDYYATII